MKYAYKNLKGNLVRCSKPKEVNEYGFRVVNEYGVHILVRKDNLFKQVKHNEKRKINK